MKFMAPLEMGISKEEAQELLKEFKDVLKSAPTDIDKLNLSIINNYLAFYAGEFKEIIEIEKNYKSSYLE